MSSCLRFGFVCVWFVCFLTNGKSDRAALVTGISALLHSWKSWRKTNRKVICSLPGRALFCVLCLPHTTFMFLCFHWATICVSRERIVFFNHLFSWEVALWAKQALKKLWELGIIFIMVYKKMLENILAKLKTSFFLNFCCLLVLQCQYT